MPPSAVHRSAAAGGLAAALMAGETLSLASSAGAVTADSWAKLRACESTSNYGINSGNGFYGAYQFNLQTWHGLGYPGLPSDAAPAVQDQAAQRLYDARGWQPWPACSARLGLVDDRAASRGGERLPLTPVVATTPAKPATAPAAPRVPAPPAAKRSTHVATTKPAVAGSWSGHYLTTRDVGHVRADVTAWQEKMVAAGYHITVDGKYGKQSAAATTQFEATHGLSVEHPGIVGPQVWSALFK
jgi:peptidoglycan hydrolase-like protein with peptidoglycan-binding domain